MSNIKEEPKVKDNTRLFRKIVREFNKEYGYSFELPKDTDYSSKYAHPVHKEANLEITGQIDDEKDEPYIYALYLKKDGIDVLNYSPRHDGMTYEKVKKLISTEQFKYRLGVVKHLEELAQELKGHINLTRSNLLEETLKDIEREDNYDMAVKVAKALYRED